MPIGIPQTGGEFTASAVSLLVNRALFIDSGGSNSDAATSIQWIGISPWDAALGESLVRANDNILGRMSNLRGKVTPFSLIGPAFGFTAGADTRVAFRSPVDNSIWVLLGPTGPNGEIGQSVDDGVTWSLITTGTIQGFTLMNLAQQQSGRLWIRGDAGANDLIYSDDSGANWNLSGKASIAGSGTSEGLQICPVTDRVIYADGGFLFQIGAPSGGPPTFDTIDLTAQGIRTSHILFNDDETIAMNISQFGSFGFSLDLLQTFTPIPDSVNPLIRGDSVAATTAAQGFYSSFYKGFVVMSTDAKSQTAAFFPEDDLLSPVTIPWTGSGTIGPGTGDDSGYVMFIVTSVANRAFAGLLPSPTLDE